MYYPALDPDVIDPVFHPRACNDGGGRNGCPTLLEAIVTLMGTDASLHLTRRNLEALSEIVGHARPSTTMGELREMAQKRFTIWMLPAGRGSHVIAPTLEGRELLEQLRRSK